MIAKDCYQAFKPGDIRGRFPEAVNDDLARFLGIGLGKLLGEGNSIVVGRDMRDSSHVLHQALLEGLVRSGIDVLDLGLCPTEWVYYATMSHEVAAGVMITASHNPRGHNGFKVVRAHGVPITGESGLYQIRDWIQEGALEITQEAISNQGKIMDLDVSASYCEFIEKTLPLNEIGPLRLLLNGLNGCAALAAKPLMEALNHEVTWVNDTPSSQFHAEGPNPTMPYCLKEMKELMVGGQYDLGIAWDGDADRCLFFDHEGQMISNIHVMLLIAESLLGQHPSAKIVHEPKVYWGLSEVIDRCGGQVAKSKTGHAFMKQVMKENQAVYGAELSAHHYFKSFSYCDSGMLPWRYVLDILGQKKIPLHELIKAYEEGVEHLDEENVKLTDLEKALEAVTSHYRDQATHHDEFDGLNFEFADEWRFHLRASNTEPLVRLNVEGRLSKEALTQKREDILVVLNDYLCLRN